MADQSKITAYGLVRGKYPDLDQLVEILTPGAPHAIALIIDAWKYLYGRPASQDEVTEMLSRVIELDVRFTPLTLKLSREKQDSVATVFAAELYRRGISEAMELGKVKPSSE